MIEALERLEQLISLSFPNIFIDSLKVEHRKDDFQIYSFLVTCVYRKKRNQTPVMVTAMQSYTRESRRSANFDICRHIENRALDVLYDEMRKNEKKS